MFEERLIAFEHDRLELRFATRVSERRPASGEELRERVEALDPERCRRVVFAGGAPLDHPDVPALARRCRERGVASLGVELAAGDLAAPERRRALEEGGFDRVFAYLGGLREEVHRAVLRDGSELQAACAALESTATAGRDVYVGVPCLRANRADVLAVVEWLAARGRQLPARGVLLALPEIARVPRGARRALLSPVEASALAAAAFERAARAGLEVGFATRRGVPACAAPRVLDRFGTVFHDRFAFFRGRGEPLRRVAACAECSLQGSCRGLEPELVETWGEEGLRPVPLEVSSAWRLRSLNRLDDREFKHVSAFANEAPAAAQRALVRINGHCNMSCAFCFVDRTVPDFDAGELEGALATLRAGGADHAVLSGGEPTLHPELPRLVGHARALGFRTIELQTNGVRLADDAYAAELVAAGLTKATVSLHSADPAVSDRITRLPGAFGRTERGIEVLRRLGVETQIAHVITKENYQALPRMASYLAERFPVAEASLSVCFAIAQGISDLTYPWVIPTFAEIKPFFREALDTCLEHGIGFGGLIGQGGYPPCLLDGDLRYYREVLGQVFRSADWDEQFHKAARCAGCSFDPLCLGVRRAYAEAYGDDELRPFRAELPAGVLPAARAAPPSAPLVRLGRKPHASAR
ncbi:MAG: radical SAM protein [Polyangiaceae bacterium]|nr:radical SAM protein [Polyangiaceae bacterium]